MQPSRWASSFAPITSIVPEDRSTWEDRIFLTVDVEWASDDVFADTLGLLERAEVACTFFVTHRTQLLDRLRENPRFELGIHPNFNPLLNGEANGGSAASVVASLLEIVPEARSVRSHSMTQSSQLLKLFKAHGLTHDCNHFVPANSGIALKPYRHWDGMVRVPYFWEDDVSMLYGDREPMQALRAAPGLKVFDFHPIHVALNTTHLERYEASRSAHAHWAKLREHVCQGEGARFALESLLWG